MMKDYDNSWLYSSFGLSGIRRRSEGELGHFIKQALLS